MFVPRLLQKVLRFVSRIYTVQYDTALCRVGNCQSSESTVSDAVVRIWLWSTQLGDHHWATSVALLQVVDNLPQILW